MNIFYSIIINHAEITLTDEEARHCTQVLRYKVGDTVLVTDGIGNLYDTRIAKIGKKEAVLTIINKTVTNNVNKIKINIACAPTKNIDRYEWFLEKATEIGVTEITPLICFQSERRHVRLDRLEKIIVAAAKQSLKYHFPVLSEVIDYKDFVTKNIDFEGQKFIAYCHANMDRKVLKIAYTPQQNALILIGPEGDFSHEEVAFATQNGFIGVSISESRLRTETAALVAVHTFNLLNS